MKTLLKEKVDSKIRADGRTVKEILVFYQGGSQVRVDRTDVVDWQDVEKAVVRFKELSLDGLYASHDLTVKASK